MATCWRWVVETWNQVLSDIWLRVAVAAVVLALYAIRYVSRMEWHAPVGVYIAILGAMAAGVTLRKDPSPREKAVWIVLITVLMVAEIHTLVVDEKEHTAATKSISDALATTNSGLKETLSGLQGVTSKIGGISTDIKTGSDTGNSQFTTTLQGLQKAISSETGGNSFCYLMPSHLSNEGINLALISVGHYPLYNVGMRITDLHLMATLKNAFSSDVVSTNIGDIAPAGSARMLSISLPFKVSGDHQAFNVFFSARNGWWIQMWRFERVNGQWEEAVLVTGALDPKYRKGAILKRYVTKGFPLQKLAEDKSWNASEKLLPKAAY